MISLFCGGIINTKQVTNVSIDEVILKLKTKNVLIDEIRKEPNKDKRDKIKSKLDYVCFAGSFSERSKNGLIKASGLACLDLDHIENLEKVKEDLSKDVYTHLLFISPGGDGLKLVVKIPLVSSDEEYKSYWEAVAQHYNLKEFDEKTKDISRACYISYDSEPYYNSQSKVFTEKLEGKTKGIPSSDIQEDDPIIKSTEEKWLQGNRQNLALSLAGYLRKNKKYGFKHAEQIVRGICERQKDNELESRLKALQETYMKDEGEIKGISGLQESGIVQEKRKEIILPSQGKLISEFAGEVAEELKDKYELFFRPSSNDVLEIRTIEEKEGDRYTGFSQVRAERFITLVEKYFVPSIKEKNKKTKEVFIIPKSMNSSQASIVLQSQELHKALPKIKRIFLSPIPIIYNEKLTFPKKGYDERFQSYTPLNAPDIKEMSLEEAKIILKNVYQEFCFQDKQDFNNAIAGLLTPYLKGLYPTMNTRMPVMFYMANRERAGKDYCADITGLVHEGYALQEPPISNGESKSGNNEELRKKMLSALIAGRRRLHFANNKGYIDNAVFEGIITSGKYSDRALGKNELSNYDNEMDFSLSGNVGIGFTSDLANRSIFIRLFLDIEDANSRRFDNPNLHEWVKNNRALILSALYSLVNNWFEKGSPEGKVAFASFPEWSRICGGIMECAGFESPCNKENSSLTMGGDIETADMKTLFELGFQNFPDRWITKQELSLFVMSQEDLFSYLDFNKRSDQVKFGSKLKKFVGRVLSDITLKVKDTAVRSSRQELMFTKEKHSFDKTTIFGNLGNLGILSNPSYSSKQQNNNKYIDSKSIPSIPSIPKDLNFEGVADE